MRQGRIGILVAAAAALVLALAYFSLRGGAEPARDDPSGAKDERSDEVESTLEEIEATIARSADVEPETPSKDTPTAKSIDSNSKIRLVGEVRDREHRPIRSPGREVNLGASVSIETGEQGRVRGATDGTFAFEDLAPGKVEMSCGARDFRMQRRTITLIAGEGEHREDFELDPVWKLDVRVVLSDGRDLSSKEVRSALLKSDLGLRVSKEPPPDRWSCTWSERERAQKLVDRDRGDEAKGIFAQLRLRLEPPIHLSADLAGYVVASTRLDSEVDRVTLEIPIERFASLRSSFACKVVDRATGAPIRGARVHLHPMSAGGKNPSLTSDAAGEVRGDDLPVGDFLLAVNDPSRSRPWKDVELLPGKLTDLGTIALDENLSLDLRFVDPVGRPLEVEVGLFPCSHRNIEATASFGQRHASSNSEGRCRVEKLARSEYVLRRVRNQVIQDGVSIEVRPQIVDLRRGAIPELVVTLEPAQSVRLQPSSEDVRELAYWIHTSEGALCRRGRLGPGPLLPRAALVPGAYLLLVGRDREHAREIPFTVGNSPMTIQIGP